MQISSKGWRTDEPIPIAPEKPRLMKKMAEVLYGSSLPLDRIAAAADMLPTEVSRILDLYADAEKLLQAARSRIVAFPSPVARGSSTQHHPRSQSEKARPTNRDGKVCWGGGAGGGSSPSLPGASVRSLVCLVRGASFCCWVGWRGAGPSKESAASSPVGRSFLASSFHSALQRDARNSSGALMQKVLQRGAKVKIWSEVAKTCMR